MIGLFLVTHGTLGEALIQCVCHVLDKRPPLLGQLGLSAGEDPADALPLARRMIATVDDGEGVLLLAARPSVSESKKTEWRSRQGSGSACLTSWRTTCLATPRMRAA